MYFGKNNLPALTQCIKDLLSAQKMLYTAQVMCLQSVTFPKGCNKIYLKFRSCAIADYSLSNKANTYYSVYELLQDIKFMFPFFDDDEFIIIIDGKTDFGSDCNSLIFMGCKYPEHYRRFFKIRAAQCEAQSAQVL